MLPNAGQASAADFTGTMIDFGDILFAPGRAFAWDGEVSSRVDDTEEPFTRSWQNGNPSILTESMRWADVQSKLAQLPLMAKRGAPATKQGKRIELASDRSASHGFVLD